MFFNHQHAVQNVTQNYSSGEQLSSGDVYECACDTCGHTCNSVYQCLWITKNLLKHLFYYVKVTLVKSREKCGNKSMLKLQNGGKREKLILYQGWDKKIYFSIGLFVWLLICYDRDSYHHLKWDIVIVLYVFISIGYTTFLGLKLVNTNKCMVLFPLGTVYWWSSHAWYWVFLFSKPSFGKRLGTSSYNGYKQRNHKVRKVYVVLTSRVLQANLTAIP